MNGGFRKSILMKETEKEQGKRGTWKKGGPLEVVMKGRKEKGERKGKRKRGREGMCVCVY